jgi:predicted Zn-dependent protease
MNDGSIATVPGHATLPDAALPDAAGAPDGAATTVPEDLVPLAAWCEQAIRRQDWNAARRGCETLRHRYPDDSAGYLLGARSLRGSGHAADSEALLADAVARFPGDPALLLEWTDLAVQRRDRALADVRSRCALLRDRFPDDVFGYLITARALCGADRWDEAESLLAQTVARFPHDVGALVDWTHLALHQRDIAAACHRGGLLCERFPGHAFARLLAVRVLREAGRTAEAETLLGDTVGRFPDDPDALLDWIDMAQARHDLDEAVHRSRQFRLRFPDHVFGYVVMARIFRATNDTTAAESLLREAVARFPHEASPLVDWAMLAQQRDDLTQAAERCAVLRARFPGHVFGYVAGAQALGGIGETVAAEALLAEATQRFPADAEPAVAYAMLANDRHDWREAARRWQVVLTRFPDYEPQYDAVAQPLRSIGHFRDLENLIGQGRLHLPDDEAALVEYGWMAHARQDWAAAEQRWAAVRERFPEQVAGYTGAALACRECRRFDEAEQLLRAAMARLPAEPSPPADLARVAEARGDWAEAEQRWSDFLQRFPDQAGDGSLLYNLLDVALAAGDSASTPAVAVATPLDHLRRIQAQRSHVVASEAAQETPPGAAEDLSELMLSFESLGHNCEFGLVQRRGKAEPLGLLRFSSIEPEQLIAALEGRFAGMGDVGQLEVVVGPGGQDYMVRDRRFGSYYHAWVSVGAMGPEEILRRESRRVPFLIRKLVEDLTLAEKLFVYQAPEVDLTTVRRLARAVRGYGNGTLFWVALADAGHPARVVEPAGPGLIRGYIDYFAPMRDVFAFSFDCWITLCRNARALHRTTG